MKTWQIVLVALAALATAGCQADPNIALLERDLRRKEDEIYRLRDQLEDCQAELQAARRAARLRTAGRRRQFRRQRRRPAKRGRWTSKSPTNPSRRGRFPTA